MANPVEHLKKRAKKLLRSVQDAEPTALEQVRLVYRDLTEFGLMRAQHVVARIYGFVDWEDVKGTRLDRVQAAIDAVESEPELDMFAGAELNDMLQKRGVAFAIAFFGRSGVSGTPDKHPGGEPQPLKTSFLELPFRGVVTTQGFDHVLTEEEQDRVSARFPGLTARCRWRHPGGRGLVSPTRA